MVRGPSLVLPLAFAALTACVQTDRLVETPDGPVLVVADENLARFSAAVVDGIEVSPFPDFGGLLALGPDGAPLSLDDRSRAETALQRHCGGPVGDVSFRGYGDDGFSTWSSAPCDDADDVE